MSLFFVLKYETELAAYLVILTRLIADSFLLNYFIAVYVENGFYCEWSMLQLFLCSLKNSRER